MLFDGNIDSLTVDAFMCAPTFSLEIWVFAVDPSNILHVDDFLVFTSNGSEVIAETDFATATGPTAPINEWALLRFVN